MAHRLWALLGPAMLVAAGCAGASDGAGSRPTLDVRAAASLADAFRAAAAGFEEDHASSVRLAFAGSQFVVREIVHGAPADVVALADEHAMARLAREGFVLSPVRFARNRLAIGVAAGNPKRVRSLADLTRRDVVLVLADETVPVGRYAREAFARAGLPPPEPRSLELDAPSTLAKLTSGEADAVVVYATDLRAAGRAVEAVAIPDEHDVLTTYEIAVTTATRRRAAAQAFVDYVVGGGGQQALRALGFLPAGARDPAGAAP